VIVEQKPSRKNVAYLLILLTGVLIGFLGRGLFDLDTTRSVDSTPEIAPNTETIITQVRPPVIEEDLTEKPPFAILSEDTPPLLSSPLQVPSAMDQTQLNETDQKDELGIDDHVSTLAVASQIPLEESLETRSDPSPEDSMDITLKVPFADPVEKNTENPSNAAEKPVSMNRDSVQAMEQHDGFLLVTGGNFYMGDRLGLGLKYEKPVRDVRVNSFFISPREVSGYEWKEIMGSLPAGFLEASQEHPVEFITWFDAVNFCNALSNSKGYRSAYKVDGIKVEWDRSSNGYRLPTEAEWEFSAREGVDNADWRFSGNNDARMVATYEAGMPGRMGTLRANKLGIFDMSGNVAEWCWDWFAPYTATDSTDNPNGPETGKERILRGGSWYGSISAISVSARGSANPMNRLRGVGLRLVRTGSQ